MWLKLLYTIILVMFFLVHQNLADTNVATTSLDDDYCRINNSKTAKEICTYVSTNGDICEGGGYLLWSQYVECQENIATKVIVIVTGVIFMLILFVMISSTADDFFSPSVSAIVAHLKISESIAGVTFMAFGNGAPDIFGSIASVLSSPMPKAGLALGELLGAGVFVTTMVTATIVLTKPFKVDIYATFRDLIFYLIALGWILFVFLYGTQVFIWEPCVYLGLYALYVIAVIIGHTLHRRRKKMKRRQNSLNTERTTSIRRRDSIVPEIHVISDAVERITGSTSELETNKYTKRTSIAFHGNLFKSSAIITCKENEEDNECESDTSEEEFVVSHNHVYTGHEARSRATSIAPPPVIIDSTSTFLLDVYNHLRPLSETADWNKMNRFSQAIAIINIPAILLFKLTIPLHECSWSKAVTIIQAICAPQWLLFAVQMISYQPFNGSPGLFVYAFVISAVIVILLICFTSMSKEPKYYKELSSYIGFIMSISWIYFISSEVVNIVTMLGVISQISHEVLGLTILAWSNSIGDLIADVSVVKQGYPRMAFAAAIGGPLFNLLIGFGLPFMIAKANKKTVLINLNPTYRILMLFLGISLVTTLIGLFPQKFFLRRPYAIILISIYICFIIMIILTETNVLVWN